MFTLHEAFDLHFYFRCPQALAMTPQMSVKVADAKGRRAEQMLRIPIQYYQQKTSLIFPFRGRALLGRTGSRRRPWRRIGTDFAIDVRGLDQNYAEQKNDADENASASGWGREILAPAAGIVTYARNDYPTTRAGNPDINSYAALHDPVMRIWEIASSSTTATPNTA